jgi:hypothetical protein
MGVLDARLMSRLRIVTERRVRFMMGMSGDILSQDDPWNKKLLQT